MKSKNVTFYLLKKLQNSFINLSPEILKMSTQNANEIEFNFKMKFEQEDLNKKN